MILKTLTWFYWDRKTQKMDSVSKWSQQAFSPLRPRPVADLSFPDKQERRVRHDPEVCKQSEC